MICFLDLDGVLINFLAEVHKFFALPYDVDNYPYEFGRWDILPPKNMSMSKSVFWDSLDEDFYANLTWTKDGKQILSFIEEVFGKDNICLLTSTTNTPGCSAGKVKWIQKNLSHYKRQFLIGPPKQFCAHDKAVLIDDKDRNISDFQFHGGYGILVPRAWNSEYKSMYNSFDVLYSKLSELSNTESVWKT